jgi:Resolvase, N terminal domain
LDPIRLDHVGALKRLSTEEHDLEDSQQTIDSTGKDVGNCKLVRRSHRDAARARNPACFGPSIHTRAMPGTDELTVGLLAVIAQHERRLISERTRAALAAAKGRGVVLGNPANLDDADRRRGNAASAAKRRARAEKRAADLLPYFREIRAGGANTLRQIAAELNRRGVPAPRGGRWQANMVRRLTAMEAACAG